MYGGGMDMDTSTGTGTGNGTHNVTTHHLPLLSLTVRRSEPVAWTVVSIALDSEVLVPKFTDLDLDGLTQIPGNYPRR